MKNILLLLSILVAIPALAQDIQFAQLANAPLNINPANTGFINGDYRAAVNYRNDWNLVTVPFVSTSFSYDMNLLKSNSKRSSFGFGLLRTDHIAGDGNLSIKRTGASLAYHRSLNKNTTRPSTLSFGLQTSLVQKSGELYFVPYTSQYPIEPVPWGGEYQVPNYLDYNAGIMFTGYIKQRLSFYSGMAYNHFTSPVEHILGYNTIVQPRVSAQLGGTYAFNKRLNFLFSTLYAQQGKSYDVILGGAAAYNFSPKQPDKRKQLIATLGTYYNYNHALIPYVHAEWQGFRLGLSADIPVYALTEATQGGGFEFSLQYNGLFKSGNAMNQNRAVPRF